MSLPDNAKHWTTRHDDRSNWGPGPWQDEPDKISWTDPATGRPCLIVRGPLGALCGYVAVDPDHPLHGASYSGTWGDDVEKNAMDAWEAEHGEIEVHGGLTYADACAHSEDQSAGICHVPDPGKPADVWWFGFDCSHCMDESPGMRIYSARLGGTYRRVPYVVRECEALARQLAGGAS